MDDWDDEYENTNFESVQEDDIVLNSLDDFKEDDLFVEKMGFSKSLEHAIMCNDGRVALKLVEELIRDKAERKLKGLVKMSNSEIRRRSRIVITNKFVRLSANSVEEKPFVFVISILEAFVEKERSLDFEKLNPYSRVHEQTSMDMHLYFAAKAFLESLIYYLSHLGIEDKKAILVEEIKPALNQIQNSGIWGLAVLAYRVQVDHVTLVEKLKDMVRDEHMEVATNLVLSFGLQNSMEKSVLLAHLIRKKRVDLVLRYIESSDFSLKKEVINEFGFKMSNLQLACRLISKLGLSVEDFPEILESKKRQAACWAIELKNFCDFVDDFLLESEELKKFILSKLYLKKMHREFILACKKFSLEHKFQNQLEICHNSIRKKAISLQGDNISPDAEEEFIEHVGPILMIDDMESFEYAKSYVFMKKPRVVGIDCEFKVRCIPFSPKPLVSLLQISIEGVTFCFDMMVYPKYYEEWSTLFEYILVSESILKLGYGLSGDFSELNESFSCLSTCFSNSNPCLDLQDIEKYLVDRSHPLGLAGITELLLQKNLCKDEQISNWEQRPLRISQICYASLDSQILLKLYRAVTELNVPVTDEIRPISVSTEL